jgi:cell wall-associated NlpC family hydrolase
LRNTNTWTIAALAVLILLSAALSAFAAKENTSQISQLETGKVTPADSPDQITLVLEPNQAIDDTQNSSASYLPSDQRIGTDPASESPSERLELKQAALGFLGTPYRWGGTTPSAFDCSGFTRYVYAKLGVRLPRTARQQYKAGIPVKAGEWRTGDLVFFDIKKGYVSHVGLYLSSCTFIHASNPVCGVKIDTLKKPFYKKYYVGARAYGVT